MMVQVYEEIGEGLDELDMSGRKLNMRAYCSWFNFTGSDQQKKVANLSGGERNRLQLAKVKTSKITMMSNLTLLFCDLGIVPNNIKQPDQACGGAMQVLKKTGNVLLLVRCLQ